MLEVARKNHLDADALHIALDEIAHREKQGAVRNRIGLLIDIARQMRDGTFFGNGARAERGGGQPLSDEEINMTNEGGICPE